MHLADAFVQNDIQAIIFFNSMCVPWELNPLPFALHDGFSGLEGSVSELETRPIFSGNWCVTWDGGSSSAKTPWTWATTVGVSCTAGQNVSRWMQLPSDPAVFESTWQWVTGILWISQLQWGSTRSKQETAVPASWSNPTPRLQISGLL